MKLHAGAALASLALAACAGVPAGPGDIADPYEGFNRQVFAFNNRVDRYALSPAATAYKTVTPGFARARAGDFLSNLRAPVTLANDVLQAEPSRAGNTLARFTLNTTIGLLGLWDAAGHFGLAHHSEDFGQTLAIWGIESGPFLVMPILGPTTPRDLLGAGVDRALDPLTWTEIGHNEDTDLAARAGLGIIGALNARLRFDEEIETLNAQPEPYVALRRLYSSQRQAAIANGRINEAEAYEDLPDFDVFDD